MRDSNNTGMIQLSNIGDPFIYRSDFYSVPAFPCVHDIFKTQHPRGGAGRAVCATTVRRIVWRIETALNVPCSGARAAELKRFTRAHASCGSRVARSADTSGAWLRFRPSSRVSGLWPRAHREAEQRAVTFQRP